MNIYQSGILLTVFGPLVLHYLGAAGFSETCSNELVQITPALIGQGMIHLDEWRKGRKTLGGKHV